ncbi:MAG TPA: dihydropteroate synthase, partial [Saprospiraceae bacterium]|nr:dihydropteroate synthase [Saprospiraceae bacterium]
AYADVVQEVLDFFIQKLAALRQAGVHDVLLDVGFGFGKSLEHNYALLKHLGSIKAVLGLPMLVGLSRKSMINKALGIRAADALNGTTALHMFALQQGADMLRVHDVREAAQSIRLWQMYRDA